MVRKLKITENLSSSDIRMFANIGVENGEVIVKFYDLNTSQKYEVLDDYKNINGILAELHKMDRKIPQNISMYDTVSFDEITSNLTLRCYNNGHTSIQISMDIYISPRMITREDLADFGIREK